MYIYIYIFIHIILSIVIYRLRYFAGDELQDEAERCGLPPRLSSQGHHQRYLRKVLDRHPAMVKHRAFGVALRFQIGL